VFAVIDSSIFDACSEGGSKEAVPIEQRLAVSEHPNQPGYIFAQ